MAPEAHGFKGVNETMSVRHLNILWTNADPLTSHNMVVMYATNAILRQWWDEVTVIIWGAPLTEILQSGAPLLTV